MSIRHPTRLAVVAAVALLTACTTSSARGQSGSSPVKPDPVSSSTTIARQRQARERLSSRVDHDQGTIADTFTFTGTGCTSQPNRKRLVVIGQSTPGGLPGAPLGPGVTPGSDGSFVIPWTWPSDQGDFAGSIDLVAVCQLTHPDAAKSLPDTASVSAPITLTIKSPHTIDFPRTVQLGEVVHFSAVCPQPVSAYTYLYFTLMTPTGVVAQDLGAHPEIGGGRVEKSVTITAPPGEYHVSPACTVERTPNSRAFQPFDVTVQPQAG